MRVYCFGLLGAGGADLGDEHGAPWGKGLFQALGSLDGEVKANGRLRGVLYAWLGNLSVNVAGLFLVLSKGNAFGAFGEWLVDPGLFTWIVVGFVIAYTVVFALMIVVASHSVSYLALFRRGFIYGGFVWFVIIVGEW